MPKFINTTWQLINCLWTLNETSITVEKEDKVLVFYAQITGADDFLDRSHVFVYLFIKNS